MFCVFENLFFMKAPISILFSAFEIKTNARFGHLNNVLQGHWQLRTTEIKAGTSAFISQTWYISILALLLSVFLFHTVQPKRKDKREHKKTKF